MATKTNKAKNVRSAMADAIRVTVYCPPPLHARLTERWKADQVAARAKSKGPRTVKRVTLSDTFIKVAQRGLR